MIVDLTDLKTLMREPHWLDVTQEAPHFLGIALESNVPNDFDLAAALRWLSFQPLPILGIGAHSKAWAEGIDCFFDDVEAAQPVIAGITANPRAAAAMVQVTRITSQLSLRDALVVESLAYSTLLAGEEFKSWLQSRPAPRARPLEDPVILDRFNQDLVISLNAPRTRNALSIDMRDALREAFQLVLLDASILKARVYGLGPAFCSGGDLDEFGLATDLSVAHHVRQLRMPGQTIGLAPERFHFWVHGACIGGGIETPAFAGHISADPDCVFRLPEIGFGLVPGAGGCVSIPRRIGRHRTNAWALSQTTINAQTALEWGLVDELSARPNWAVATTP